MESLGLAALALLAEAVEYPDPMALNMCGLARAGKEATLRESAVTQRLLLAVLLMAAIGCNSTHIPK